MFYIEILIDERPCLFRESKEHIERLLFNDSPLIRKDFSEELYMFMLERGQELLGEESQTSLIDALGSVEVVEEEGKIELKKIWDNCVFFK